MIAQIGGLYLIISKNSRKNNFMRMKATLKTTHHRRIKKNNFWMIQIRRTKDGKDGGITLFIF